MGHLILGSILGGILLGGSSLDCSNHGGIVHCKMPTYPRPDNPYTKKKNK